MKSIIENAKPVKRRWKKVSHGPAEHRPTETKEAKLELVTQADAETEKQIEANVKTMRLGVNGHRRSESLQYLYAAVVGAAANRLADLMPARGGLEKLLEQKFHDVSKSQLHVWRNFAKDLIPHQAISPIIGLIAAPQVGKNLTIPAKKAEAFQDAVKRVLKGATMVEFHKASQFCGEPTPAGGDRGGAKGQKISDEDAAELLREEVRANARDAAALMEDQRALVRLMDDMAEFGKIRMVYHDLNQMMLDMEKKANIAAGDKRGAEWKKKKAASAEAEVSAEAADPPLQRFMAIQTVYAFQKGLKPMVKPYDMEEIIEACKSPSVAGIIRLIEARDHFEAESIATRKMLAGDMERTFGCPAPKTAVETTALPVTTKEMAL